MQIRTANSRDYSNVRDFYYVLIDAMEDAEYKPGWKKDIYPTQTMMVIRIFSGLLKQKIPNFL